MQETSDDSGRGGVWLGLARVMYDRTPKRRRGSYYINPISYYINPISRKIFNAGINLPRKHATISKVSFAIIATYLPTNKSCSEKVIRAEVKVWCLARSKQAT